ncbi:MAG: hypothetical protein M3325_09725 [Actinomycetota bacterium]|nr:hypothetical protein [Actinomycetota bacterium]
MKEDGKLIRGGIGTTHGTGGGVGPVDEGQILHHGLNFMAGVVRAVDNDDVFSSTGERQTPIADKPEISGVEPAVRGEDRSVRLGVLVVPRSHHGAVDMEPSNDSLRYHEVVAVNDAQPDTGDRPTDLHKGVIVACLSCGKTF